MRRPRQARPQQRLLLCALAALAAARAAAAAGGAPGAGAPAQQQQQQRGVLASAAGWGDPHYEAFSGQKFDVCMKKPGRECQGKAFNLLSDARHQVNVEMGRFKGGNAFPQSGTWMTGFGMRYSSGHRESSIELRLNTDFEYKIENRKAQNPEGPDAKFTKIIAVLKVDGRDVMDRLETGHSQETAGLRVHFAKARHAQDPTDGPLVIVTTPDLRITWYLESDDIWHLDFQVSVFEGHELTKAHGLLGQTIHWNKDTSPATPEGSELNYFVKDGMMGTDFKYNLYQAPKAS